MTLTATFATIGFYGAFIALTAWLYLADYGDMAGATATLTGDRK